MDMSREVRDLIGKPPAIAQVGPEILCLSEIVIVVVDIKVERLPARTRGADPYQVRSSPMPVADEISDSVRPQIRFVDYREFLQVLNRLDIFRNEPLLLENTAVEGNMVIGMMNQTVELRLLQLVKLLWRTALILQ
jgi:hypothetical protein